MDVIKTQFIEMIFFCVDLKIEMFGMTWGRENIDKNLNYTFTKENNIDNASCKSLSLLTKKNRSTAVKLYTFSSVREYVFLFFITLMYINQRKVLSYVVKTDVFEITECHESCICVMNILAISECANVAPFKNDWQVQLWFMLCPIPQE